MRTSPRFSSRKIVMAATSGWVTAGPFVLGAPSVSQKKPSYELCEDLMRVHKPARHSVPAFGTRI